MIRTLNLYSLFLLVVTLVLLTSGSAHATSWFVSPCGNDGWTGTSAVCLPPLGPKQSIQLAIDQAAPGDTVFILPGTYFETIDLDGKAITLEGTGGAALTSIDGNGDGPVVTCNSLEGAGTVLRGLTIQNGVNDWDVGNTGIGGGMFVALATPTIEACEFRNNFATGRGGAVGCTVASPTFVDCLFDGNASSHTVGGRGGAVSCRAGLPIFNGCTFNDNSALFHGGAIHLYDNATAELTGCLFTFNYQATIDDDPLSDKEYMGGAVVMLDSSASFTTCTFDDNDSSSRGAAIGISGGSATITSCAFENNSGQIFGDGLGGAMAIRNQADVTMFGTQFSSNQSEYDGAAVHVQESQFTATLCGFNSNLAGWGGGAVSGHAAEITFNQCTITENEAALGGTGVRSVAGCVLQMEGCLLSNNTSLGSSLGGGVYADSSQVDIDACTFAQNSGLHGGGMCVLGGAGSIENCTFESNTATDTGGGLFAWVDGVFTVRASHFEGNSTQFGGGVYSSGQVRVIDSTFVGNTATSGGGLSHSNLIPGTPIVLGCEFDSNVADTGAAISQIAGALRIENTVIHHHLGPVLSGAVRVATGVHLDIANSVIANNVVGGIATGGSVNAQVANSIVWANLGQFPDGVPNVRFCNVQGGVAGLGNMDLDPMFVDPGGGDYHLQAESPCIDAGSNNAVPVDTLDRDGDGNTVEFLPHDRDGNPRFADAPNEDTGCGMHPIVDMGPYESAGESYEEDIIPCDLNDDGVVDVLDLIQILGAWGPCAETCCQADFDVNGAVDLLDLLYLLGRWS